MSVPALSNPGRTSALGCYRASLLPSATAMASALALRLISGLNHTASPLADYASQAGLLRFDLRQFRESRGWPLRRPRVPRRLGAGWILGPRDRRNRRAGRGRSQGRDGDRSQGSQTPPRSVAHLEGRRDHALGGRAVGELSQDNRPADSRLRFPRGLVQIIVVAKRP